VTRLAVRTVNTAPRTWVTLLCLLLRHSCRGSLLEAVSLSWAVVYIAKPAELKGGRLDGERVCVSTQTPYLLGASFSAAPCTVRTCLELLKASKRLGFPVCASNQRATATTTSWSTPCTAAPRAACGTCRRERMWLKQHLPALVHFAETCQPVHCLVSTFLQHSARPQRPCNKEMQKALRA